ncbi:MAG TPA: FAD-dependent thymidylate synthase, partial [Candidatus Saccharimonadales bacterium]|nr:FAD-dependent thymidylate synthase [Candidatus Saccharimonadales bacterium]
METNDQPIFRSDMTVELMQSMGSDESVVAAARVSTAADHSKEALTQDAEQSKGLINFLLKNRHGTPFEHNSFTFFVQAPIFVFREFMRHRIGFSYNEESGRYRELRPIFYIAAKDRNLVQQGKPGAYDFVPGSKEQYKTLTTASKAAYIASYDAYKTMLQAGIAREVARQVLPVGLYSSMYVTCNARSLMSFLSLRTKRPDSHFPSYPQREIEMVA